MQYRWCAVLMATFLAACNGGGGGGSSSDSERSEPAPALSGTINIEANSRVDSDTGDLLAFGANTTNNSLSAPQYLPSVVLAAGYLSGDDDFYPAIGASAALPYVTDTEDAYALDLVPGQTLILQTFATREGNSTVSFSLRYASAPFSFVVPTETAFGEDSVQLTLPMIEPAGEYRLLISVAAGQNPVRYVLSTAPGTSSLGAVLRWPDANFVDGEAIVELVDENAATMNFRSVTSYTRVHELGPNTHLVRKKTFGNRSASALSRQETLDWIAELRNAPEVRSVAPNYLATAQSPLDEPLFSRQWHYSLINGPTAWQLEPSGGAGVRVAVLDTGLFRSGPNWHPDLNANVSVLANSDFVSGSLDDDATPGRDSNPADPGDPLGGSVYHGTHVAGTVAALASNNLGGTGMAFGATLIPVRVLAGTGTGTAADLLDAIRWVSGLNDNTARRADVVNMSLGGLPFIQSMQDAITDAVEDKGVIFVAAAGNENSGAPSYPAAFDNVFSVSAVDGAARKAGYSNYGSTIDVAAPGGDALRDANADGRADVVVSTSASVINGSLQPTYIGLQGTSMAAPHVAGVFALMKVLDPSLTSTQLQALLANGDLTEDIGATGRDDLYGYGLIDAGRAAYSALTGAVPKLLSPSPASVNFTSGNETITLNLDVLAGTITLNSLDGPPWLQFAAPVVLSSSAGFSIDLSVDSGQLVPDQLTQGAFAVEYTDDDGMSRTLDVPVVAQILSDENARDAGTHFVILIGQEPNPDTGFFEAIAQAEATAENGEYRFSFRPDDGEAPQSLDEVEPGEYFLVAGTDLDNDGVICDDGEACAEYPIAGLRQTITVVAGEPLTGIEMTTSYTRPVISESVLPRLGFKGYRLKPSEAAAPEGRMTR